MVFNAPEFRESVKDTTRRPDEIISEIQTELQNLQNAITPIDAQLDAKDWHPDDPDKVDELSEVKDTLKNAPEVIQNAYDRIDVMLQKIDIVLEVRGADMDAINRAQLENNRKALVDIVTNNPGLKLYQETTALFKVLNRTAATPAARPFDPATDIAEGGKKNQINATLDKMGSSAVGKVISMIMMVREWFSDGSSQSKKESKLWQLAYAFLGAGHLREVGQEFCKEQNLPFELVKGKNDRAAIQKLQEMHAKTADPKNGPTMTFEEYVKGRLDLLGKQAVPDGTKITLKALTFDRLTV